MSFVIAVVMTMPIIIALSHKCALVHVHVCAWIIRNAIVFCWVSAQEGDQYSALCDLFPKLLLSCHWCMPDVLHVSHAYSTHLHLSHSEGLLAVGIAVTFHDHAMHPRTPILPLDCYSRSCRKECRVFVSVIILSVCFLP